MVRLCDIDIEQWLKKKKLMISPVPSARRINGATVDLRLGNQFRSFRRNVLPFIDLSEKRKRSLRRMKKVMENEIYLTKEDLLFLSPGELVLATTLESLTLPNNLVGWIDGCSSLARFGLMVHITAQRVDPGWKGKIVLECYNFGKIPLALRPGMKICSLSFELLSNPSIRPYNLRKDAKYYNQKNIFIK